MISKKIQTGILSLVLFFIGSGYSLAALELSIPKNMTVSDADHVTQITIPIQIKGLSSAAVSTYKIRLDYDDTGLSNSVALTNPVAIIDGTLSAGKDVRCNTPQDNKGGKIAIVLFNEFAANNDGVLFKLRLDVDNDNFISSSISFLLTQTELMLGDSEYTYSASDGVLVGFKSNYENNVVSVSKKGNDEVIISEDSGGLQLESTSFSQDGYVLAGHNNGNLLFENPVTNEYDQLLSRTWYVDYHDSKPDTITLKFTIPQVTEPVSHYGLLTATDDSSPSNFVEVVQPTVVNNNTVTFELTSAQLIEKQYYTVGLKYQTLSTDVEARSVPSLNEWGLMIFASILLLWSIMRIKYQVKSVS